MSFVYNDEVRRSDCIQTPSKSLNRRDHNGQLRHGFTRLNKPMGHSNTLQGGADLVKNLATMRDDDHPGSTL